MYSHSYYLLRSKVDGQYLVARPRPAASPPASPEATPAPAQFLMVFAADHEALSYVNAHAPDLANQFAIETVSPPQLRQVLDRWGYTGIGLVRDALVPQVDFLLRDTAF